MKINICNDNKIFPFLYVDDRYTPEEEKLIWKELDFYTNPYAMMRSEDDPNTGVFEDGNSKSRGWRIHVNEMYSGLIRDKDGKEYPLSHILRFQPQFTMWPEELEKVINEISPNFRMLDMTNSGKTMINYSETDDYYESHNDNCMISTLCWFHRKPKAYTGGDITFTDTDTTLECKHNRMVMFPGYYSHEAHPTKMKKGNLEMGWGRYSIVNFYSSHLGL